MCVTNNKIGKEMNASLVKFEMQSSTTSKVIVYLLGSGPTTVDVSLNIFDFVYILNSRKKYSLHKFSKILLLLIQHILVNCIVS